VGLQGKYVGPLCRVSVMINGKDVVMNPPVNDIYKYLTKLGKNIVESSKLFVRWMHGSCLECAPQFISEDEEPFIFSFLEVRPSCLISCRPMSLGPTQGSLLFRPAGHQPEPPGRGAQVQPGHAHPEGHQHDQQVPGRLAPVRHGLQPLEPPEEAGER
jgi:hypothetical protein